MEINEKRYFKSRIIEDLDARIKLTPTNSERNILFARKAFTLARHSLISEAKSLILDLRRINKNYEPRLSAWIMFAEGIIEHSESFDVAKSKDRILRAHLVGQVANDPTLAGTSAAWLAHFTFAQGNYAETKAFLIKAFSWSSSDDAEARSRACMVLGFGFYFAGETAIAKSWICRAREHAIKSGDIALQNNIFFNASSLHVAELTLSDCTAAVDPVELNFAVMSAKSAENLNTALGISIQSSMVPVQRAELLTIEHKWSEAIELFDSYIDQARQQGQSKWAPKLIAHRAWCKANTQDQLGALADIKTAVADAEICSDPDDRSVLHFRIASAARVLENVELSIKHQELGEGFLRIHREHQALVKTYFNDVVKELQLK